MAAPCALWQAGSLYPAEYSADFGMYFAVSQAATGRETVSRRSGCEVAKLATEMVMDYRGHGDPMEEIRIDSVPAAKILPKERMYVPPIIVTIEAETPRGRLALKLTPVALQGLLSQLRSLNLIGNSPEGRASKR
jgi:hypothetical protein